MPKGLVRHGRSMLRKRTFRLSDWQAAKRTVAYGAKSGQKRTMAAAKLVATAPLNPGLWAEMPGIT
jgi:hypothetical protein